MALFKTIEQDNGVILNYHRIVSINKITNRNVVVEIAGYTSKEKRDEEIRKQFSGQEYNIYIDTTYMSVDYDETSTIKDWYDYLKTTDKYKDAQDA